MKTGKLIVIEGTDCSGKETQANLLKEKFNFEKMSFPMYDTPTGKIVGGSYLGKKYISECLFEEGATNVDPKVASLYYAADRKYNINKITDVLAIGKDVLLDRYVESNMGHQGGKIFEKKDRINMYKWLEKLEYDLLELPRPDLTIFLYMPYQYATELKKNRIEEADEHEANIEHLINAENAYLELAKMYNFSIINCVKNNKVRTIEDIHQEICEIVKKDLKNKVTNS